MRMMLRRTHRPTHALARTDRAGRVRRSCGKRRAIEQILAKQAPDTVLTICSGHHAIGASRGQTSVDTQVCRADPRHPADSWWPVRRWTLAGLGDFVRVRGSISNKQPLATAVRGTGEECAPRSTAAIPRGTLQARRCCSPSRTPAAIRGYRGPRFPSNRRALMTARGTAAGQRCLALASPSFGPESTHGSSITWLFSRRRWAHTLPTTEAGGTHVACDDGAPWESKSLLRPTHSPSEAFTCGDGSSGGGPATRRTSVSSMQSRRQEAVLPAKGAKCGCHSLANTASAW